MARTKAFDEVEALDKAVALFWKQGYSSTSPEEIVSAMGISRSSLYSTFGDKRELFIKSLKNYIATQSSKLIFALNASSDAKETLRHTLLNIITPNSDDCAQYGCLAVNTSVEFSNQDPEIKQIIDENNQNILNALQGAIERSRQKGKITTNLSPDKLSQFLYNNIIGLRVNVRMKKSYLELKGVVELTLSLLD